MHIIEWEFLPALGRGAEFLAAYGSEGVWAKLFRRFEGFLGTELTALSDQPGWYRTTDRWASEAAYHAFRQSFAADYEALDLACQSLTTIERPIKHVSKDI
jgi:heme-degrading monooxygenase HmoA